MGSLRHVQLGQRLRDTTRNRKDDEDDQTCCDDGSAPNNVAQLCGNDEETSIGDEVAIDDPATLVEAIERVRDRHQCRRNDGAIQRRQKETEA